ncbi:MAG: hypothetical protein M3R17_18550, partial [Bacteroidota bacterium]|nr:hypothetical protein [Bacteroidota bacterium]
TVNTVVKTENVIVNTEKNVVQGEVNTENTVVNAEKNVVQGENKAVQEEVNAVQQSTALTFKVGDSIAGLTIKQLRVGANGRVAVIGRSMGNETVTGVKNVYAELNSKNVVAEIFDKSSLTGLELESFNAALAEFKTVTNNFTKRLSNMDIMKLEMYKLNKTWAQRLADQGYTVLDMGDFNNLGFSVFYAMEKMTIFRL